MELSLIIVRTVLVLVTAAVLGLELGPGVVNKPPSVFPSYPIALEWSSSILGFVGSLNQLPKVTFDLARAAC